MPRLFIASLLVLLATSPVLAQWGDEEPAEPTWKEKVFTGGGLGASFSNRYDYVSISPLIGYRVTPRFAPGVGFYYRYVNNKYYSPSAVLHDLGGNVFARYRITQQLFLHAEYEYLSAQYLLGPGEKTRQGFSSVMAGAGFFQPVGSKAGLFFMALYNFSYQDTSPSTPYYPYTSPLVIRAGITAGF